MSVFETASYLPERPGVGESTLTYSFQPDPVSDVPTGYFASQLRSFVHIYETAAFSRSATI